MCITKNDLIDDLLTVNDALVQTWIVDFGASFHVDPIKECFSTLLQAAMAMYTLETIMHAPLRVLAQCIFVQMALMSWFCIMYVMYQGS